MTYVVDISHYQTPTSFAAAYAWGLRGVIMKASQGVRTADPHVTKAMCDDVTGAGLLLGAYDFNTGDPPREQVDFFLDVVQPDKDTFCALDFEDYKFPMSFGAMLDYLAYADEKLDKVNPGKKMDLYSGNRLKAKIIGATSAQRAFLARRRLWGCEYGPRWRNVDVDGRTLPWPRPFLWQRTGDGIGPHPRSVPGIGTNIDVNVYEGTSDQLAAEWGQALSAAA